MDKWGPGRFVADLFAGAGGMTEGFRRAEFTTVAAVEFDKWAAQTYSRNFGDHVLACPIEQVEIFRAEGALRWRGRALNGTLREFETPEIDVLIGGPPCQGFSTLGRMNDWSFEDPRNKLWKHYFRILEVARPRAFVIENVPQLLKSAEFALLCKRSETLGYHVAFDVLNAEFYGVPQTRKRAIIIGQREAKPSLPSPILRRYTVRDAIGDLSFEPDGINWHVGRSPLPSSIERYKTVPPGGNRYSVMARRPDLAPKCWLRKRTGSTDVFGRMHWHLPAPTIRTEFFKPEKGRYLHPEAHRPITIREGARLGLRGRFTPRPTVRVG